MKTVRPLTTVKCNTTIIKLAGASIISKATQFRLNKEEGIL